MSDRHRWVTLARHAVVFELHIYLSLVRWVVRRPSVPAGTEPVGYARAVTPVMWLWIFASAVEIPLFHLLVPWHTVRIIGIVIGAWGLLWMLGLLAGLNCYPHLIGAETLRVRNGAMHDLPVPWSEIESVKVHDRDTESTVWALQPRTTPGGTDLQVAVSGRVNVHATLRRPIAVSTRKGELEIAEVSFWTDEPKPFAARARRIVRDLDPSGGSTR